MRKRSIWAIFLTLLTGTLTSTPVWSAPPAAGNADKPSLPAPEQVILKQALDDATAGNSAKVSQVLAGKNFDSLPDTAKASLIAGGLQRAFKAAKAQYRLHKAGDSLNRLKLTFSLISFVELGKTPDPDKDVDYLDTWISALNKAHLSRKDYIAPLNDYGFFLQETGKDKEAVTVFQKVVTVDSSREVAYLNLADSLWKLGRQDEAKPLYEKYKKLMKSENLAHKVPSRVDSSLQAVITTPPGSTAASKGSGEVNFAPYMAEVQRRIKTHWLPPKGNSTLSIVTIFKIDREGKISQASVTKESKVANADAAALKAITDTTLPPLPPNAPPSVDIMFTFDYNVFSNKPGYDLVERWKSRVKESNTADNHVGLGQAYEGMKDYQTAEQEYAKAVELKPNNIYYKELLQKCTDKNQKDIGQKQNAP